MKKPKRGNKGELPLLPKFSIHSVTLPGQAHLNHPDLSVLSINIFEKKSTKI